MTPRGRMLEAIARFEDALRAIEHDATEHGDTWTGRTVAWLRLAISDTAQAAELEGKRRGEL